jgi:hypothetical protein
VGESPALTILKHVHDAPAAPRSHVPELSPELEALILRALEKKREDRFSNADEFRQALRETPEWKRAPSKIAPPPREVSVRAPRSAPSGPPVLSAAPVPSSSGNRLALVLVVLLALGGAGGLGFWLARSPQPAADTAPERPTARAEALLAEGNVDAAEAELRRLVSQDAYANLLLGNLYFSRSWWTDGLDAYQRAIALDSSLKTHRTLLQNVTQALRGKTKDRAQSILFDAGKEALEPLVAAAQGSSKEVREAAAALLVQAGQGDRVDLVDLALRALEEAEGCEARRAEIAKVGALSDERAKTALLRLHQNRPKPDPDACLRLDLALALQKLGVPENELGPLPQSVPANPLP